MLLKAAAALEHQDIVLRNHNGTAVTVDGLGEGRMDEQRVDVESLVESPIPSHPLRIKPLGNQYLSSAVNARRATGRLQVLPDEVLAQLLEYFGQQSLRKLGYTCRFLFAFCHADDLWKALFLESHEEKKRLFQWKATWRSTLLELATDQEAKIDCRNVFSDVLHRPFVCSHVPLSRFCSRIPSANEIKRVSYMTYEEFAGKWSDMPFILTDCIRSWPACKEWNIQQLSKMYADVEFRAEAVNWPFSTYCQYMRDNQDESPLYLFDKQFAEKMDLTVGKGQGAAYWKPDCFGPDLFEVLDSERPAHRWLIVGPARSGSTFHKDPNGTSAWNAVLQGAKYWIMFPPSVDVPGVFVSADQSEVTSPLSIAEWLLEFHEEARTLPDCIEGICKEGEILHVPSGWWHLVVNLESGIALTQNFVPKSHLAVVLEFLRDKPDQVTGFKRDVADPYSLFVDRLRVQFPELLDAALVEMDLRHSKKKRKWDEAIATEETEQTSGSGGFSFGFGFGGDEEEIP